MILRKFVDDFRTFLIAESKGMEILAPILVSKYKTFGETMI
jgi:hypothetical protein